MEPIQVTSKLHEAYPELPTLKDMLTPVVTYECVDCLRRWSSCSTEEGCIDCDSKSIVVLDKVIPVIF